MAKTDGYITDTQDGDWRYSNTGQGTRGDVTSPNGAAYARFERQDGAIAGTQVDALGSISAGPVIDFQTLDSLLAGAPSSPGAPNVIWAGVSPLSLSEVLIVWNQSVVLLDSSKVIGGQTVSVAGRLMVVGLKDPIAIDGEEQATIVLQPGAIGVYGQGDPICVGSGADRTEASMTAGAIDGELEDLPTTPRPCPSPACGDPIVGGAGTPPASGTGAEVIDSTLFAEQLCQDGGCDPPAPLVDGQLQFLSNNQLQVPVRCCHPFYLQKLAVNGTDGNCPCIDCPVWYASMVIYGSTLPGEVFPLDQLVSISNPCQMANEVGGDGSFPAILESDVACCASTSVQLVGNFGPPVSVSGKWNGHLPGLAGQSISFNYKNETDCANAHCQTNFRPYSDADVWVEEGIMKPRHRALPIAYFDSLTFRTEIISLPATIVTDTVTLVTSCPIAVLSPSPITQYGDDADKTAAAMPTSTGRWFDDCSGTDISVCEPGGSMTTIHVLTACDGEDVFPVTITQQVRLVDAYALLIDPEDPITVVTSCLITEPVLPFAQGDPRDVTIMFVDPDGDQNVLVEATEPDCDTPFKFVMHDGMPQEWTRIISDTLLPCGPPGTGDGCEKGRNCSYVLSVMPNEVNCMAVNLMTPIWVSRSEAPGDGGCPGYDCSAENPPVPPMGSNIPNGPPDHGPVTCGILIRRPQRRPFVRCNNNSA